MYPSVVSVKPGEGYIIHVSFDNGESGILDMERFLDTGVFQKLKNKDEFLRIRVSFDTIEWENGIDLDPEFVYAACKLDTQKQK